MTGVVVVVEKYKNTENMQKLKKILNYFIIKFFFLNVSKKHSGNIGSERFFRKKKQMFYENAAYCISFF